MKYRNVVIYILILCFFSSFALAGSADSESAQASSMRLMQTEGNVTLTDQNGTKLALRNRMRLYSGCEVSTEDESRAGILLDDSKAVTIAESSSAVINQEGKKLEIAVKNGKMYFDVSKPLESDESFEIRTSTMVLGIRGTSGCVEVVSDTETLVTLISGHAEITCFKGDIISIEGGQQVRIVKNSDGSCDDLYVELTEEKAEEMISELDLLHEHQKVEIIQGIGFIQKEEKHGAVWEKWEKQYFNDSNFITLNSGTPKKEKSSTNPDEKNTSPYQLLPDGGYYDPDTGEIIGP